LLFGFTDSKCTQLHNSILVFLDLSAAFNTLNHNQLLAVLNQQYGINEKVLNWIYFYLSSRSFSVSVVGEQSLQHDLTIGILQGSILGPLLFMLFKKSLEEVVTAHDIPFHSYADDTQMYLHFQPVNECDNQFYLLNLRVA